LSKIPQITGEEMIHLLERMGFYVKRKKKALIIFCTIVKIQADLL
jgi:hypothetical protein